MPVRLVEIGVTADRLDSAVAALTASGLEPDDWDEWRQDGRVLLRVLLDADRTSPIIDALERLVGRDAHFRLVVLPVEAVLPRPAEKEKDEAVEAPPPAVAAGSVSREEIYGDAIDMSKLSRTFVVTTFLSTVVAAVGMLRDNVAVIIGAMVIAPLLGPNVALALATTLGDRSLLRRAIGTNLVGVAMALGFSSLLGMVLAVDPETAELVARTHVGLSDVALALAAGSAGVLALTSGMPSALVGVMVAVALLPPTVAIGLFAGSGEWSLALGAATLLLTNVICVNLAGVLTFVLQRIRPSTWWETAAARRATTRAIILWSTLLALLVLLIWWRGIDL